MYSEYGELVKRDAALLAAKQQNRQLVALEAIVAELHAVVQQLTLFVAFQADRERRDMP